MSSLIKSYVGLLWCGAVRMAEKKNGTRFPRLNRCAAGLQVFATFIMIPGVVMVSHFDDRPDVRHAGPDQFVLLAIVWAFIVGSMLYHGRQTNPSPRQ